MILNSNLQAYKIHGILTNFNSEKLSQNIKITYKTTLLRNFVTTKKSVLNYL